MQAQAGEGRRTGGAMIARNCLPPSRPRSSRTSLMLSNAQNALPRPSSRINVLTTCLQCSVSPGAGSADSASRHEDSGRPA